MVVKDGGDTSGSAAAVIWWARFNTTNITSTPLNIGICIGDISHYHTAAMVNIYFYGLRNRVSPFTTPFWISSFDKMSNAFQRYWIIHSPMNYDHTKLFSFRSYGVSAFQNTSSLIKFRLHIERKKWTRKIEDISSALINPCILNQHNHGNMCSFPINNSFPVKFNYSSWVCSTLSRPRWWLMQPRKINTRNSKRASLTHLQLRWIFKGRFSFEMDKKINTWRYLSQN